MFEVSTFDVCTSGFERLRSYSEVILTAHIDGSTTAADLLDSWLSEIDSCDRPDGFDYDAARTAVEQYVESTVAPLFSNRANPFNLEVGREDIGFQDECEGCTAYLYIRDDRPEAHYPVF